SNQFVRLQRETDYLKCSYCLAPRPVSDPFARFCNDCGHPITPLIQNKLPPPQVNQVGRCFTCQSMVPFNMASCIVCESPLKQQCLPRSDVKLSSMVPCVVCGTANQATLRYCVTCCASLPESNLPASLNISPTRSSSANNLSKTCSKCGRVNSSKARFCDWCQSKPIACNKCGTTNQAHAHYCANCGNLLQFPADDNMLPGFMSMNGPPALQTTEAATQTVGLFYPSVPKFKQMNILEGLLGTKDMSNSKGGDWVDQKPIITSAVSPGRGYWRKQVEHMCAHLKAHASKDTNFRSLIAHPRMGKLLQATVNEDGYELSLTLNFALRSPDNIVNTNNLKNDRMRSAGSRRTGMGDTSQRRSNLKKKNSNSRQMNNDDVNNTVSELNKSLTKEVGKLGRGRVEKVQELILEGASPKDCTTRDGLTLLHHAAIYKHYHVIPSLVEAGLHVDSVENSMHNTPLHEAVREHNVNAAAGADHGAALKVVEVLLGCGASPTKKNKLGETAYELAIRVGRQDLANKMTMYIAQNNINKLSKPKKINSDF
ncbi:hypothetical protein HELRODRAFT_67144, partial [Helobdella robusta]|uniref:DZANK-type domain-containing protein n=1 Tax=Helobdella robusta TaxID=6412 RepID=T1FYX4_HELRO